MSRAPRNAYSPVLLLAILTIALLLAGTSYGRELQGRVVGVSDGDTLTLLVGSERMRVRLSDIDAPERGQPYGRRARQSLAELCHDQTATLLAAGKDRWGRTLGVVSCAGVVANREQVRRGLAWVYSRYARADSPLHAVQGEARREGRGLWRAPDPLPPWEWRSRRRAAPAAAA